MGNIDSEKVTQTYIIREFLKTIFNFFLMPLE